ncbi:hypothetical protein [Streptomyces tropicalis]|uniref:Uncharacterized protein n=1 Tax=Streptomyces tropicalis TaxID=3034234 RepID=A0ABT6A1Z2_9ACTN|nr:hypothetical protein [Streptomyces tropicalis]MDF3298401.1 hypothetical protein [Streptomyces tropicalis]
MKLIGFYQEMDSGYSVSWGGPVPAPETGAGKYLVPDVVDYLKSGYPILDVMELTTDVVGGAFRVPGGSSALTDGEFVWREDLASYVERYHIDLPLDFLEAARRHEFRIPSVGYEVLLSISSEVSEVLGFQPKP